MTYRQQTLPLLALCEIQTGYTARARLEPAVAGGVPAVQLRDLQGDEAFDPAGLPAYDLAPPFERYRVRPGELLFRSRGERNIAVLITGGPDTAPVALLPLMILRPDHQRVDPGYLAWFISQPEAQRHFDKCAQGTRLKVIPKPCLDELEVLVPDLATQRLVVEIDALARREHALMRELADRKLELTRSALLRQVRRALGGVRDPQRTFNPSNTDGKE